jgi:TrmH family RNA methyltransferase
MLTTAQEKLIRSLHTKKGRDASGLCLVEGAKVIETAGDSVDFSFSVEDVEYESDFLKLVTTKTPQTIAAVAKIPSWTKKEIDAKSTILVLDGVQDPGNVGTILRLCLAFDASLLLIESADVTSSKVIRSSAGAMFQVPWMKVSRPEAAEALLDSDRDIFRLEKVKKSSPVKALQTGKPAFLIAGNEGSGISLTSPGTSISIDHNEAIESLNVGTAVAIALQLRY